MVSAETKPNISSNFKLIDGRNLCYKERGVPKEKSNYRIIFIHGFDSSKERDFLAPQVHYYLTYFLHILLNIIVK